MLVALAALLVDAPQQQVKLRYMFFYDIAADHVVTWNVTTNIFTTSLTMDGAAALEYFLLVMLLHRLLLPLTWMMHRRDSRNNATGLRYIISESPEANEQNLW